MLSVGSAVFDAMFNSTLATQEDEITIPDVEPAAFLALLKFLYSDEVGKTLFQKLIVNDNFRFKLAQKP